MLSVTEEEKRKKRRKKRGQDSFLKRANCVDCRHASSQADLPCWNGVPLPQSVGGAADVVISLAGMRAYWCSTKRRLRLGIRNGVLLFWAAAALRLVAVRCCLET